MANDTWVTANQSHYAYFWLDQSGQDGADLIYA